MKKVFRKSLSWLLSVVMVFGMFAFVPSVNVSATQSKKGNFSTNYTITGDGATDIVNVAKAQIGRVGSSFGYTESWCADFVSDCAELAGQSAAVPRHGHVDYLTSNLLNAGGTKYTTQSSAKTGDIVFYDFNSNGSPDHVELVSYVSGGKIYSIGGNTSYTNSVSTSKVSNERYCGYFLYFIRPNYISTTPTPIVIDPVDLGTDFYATICHDGKVFEQINENVVLATETAVRSQLWYFERVDGLYYRITNADNNQCLDADCFGTENGTNVKTCVSNGSDAQRWAFVKSGDNYCIIPKYSTSIAVDLNGGNMDDGTNIQLWERQDGNFAQAFIIWKYGNYPTKPNVTTDDNIYSPGTAVTVSWNRCSWALSYDVDVWHNGEHTESFSYGGTSYVLGNVSNGNYKVCITASNQNGKSDTGVVEFYVQQVVDIGNDFYGYIAHYGKVLEQRDDSICSGNVVLASETDDRNQLWHFEKVDGRYYKITNVGNNKCLDANGQGKENGTNIWTYENNDSDAQKWLFVKSGDNLCIIPKYSNNIAIDILNCNNDDGTNIQIYERNNTFAQEFVILEEHKLDIGTDFYANIIHGDKVLEQRDDSICSENVVLATKTGLSNQIWYFKRMDDLSYKIINAANNKCLDAENFGTSNGTNIGTFKDNGSDNQRWYIVKSGGNVIIVPKYSLNSALDLFYGNMEDGTNIQIHDRNNTYAQEYYILTPTYNISYDMNGGDGSIENQTKVCGQDLTLSSTKPTRTGYKFVGWNTNKDAITAQYQPGDKYTANSETTLYAIWKTIEPLNNNSTVSAIIVNCNESVTLTAKAESGTAPYKFAYYYKKSTESSWTKLVTENGSAYVTASTQQFKPTTAGTYNIRINVKDNNGTGTVVSKDFNLTVKGTALKNNSTVSATTVKAGTEVTMTGKGAGGTAPYKYAYYYKKSTDSTWTKAYVTSSGSAYTKYDSVKFTPTTAGTYNVRINVKDKYGEGTVVTKDFKLTVTADTSALTNNSTVSAATVTAGTEVTMTGKAAGGTSPYKYAYYYKKSTDSTWTKAYVTSSGSVYTKYDSMKFTPKTAGTYTVRINVKDKYGEGTTVTKDFKLTVK